MVVNECERDGAMGGMVQVKLKWERGHNRDEMISFNGKNNNKYKEDSKGFRFYCPTRGTRIVEASTAKFLELDMSESSCPQPSETLKSRKSVSIPLPSLTETLLVALARKEIVTLVVQDEDPRIPVIEVP
ncbi:Retrovirus-related Pol polyprotein from transposon TNT 1-94 [Senna tora]|uniref:Retrovirus-related Pol polyprotein from transposon TNT 1-94 n=1 Tax=Senna tora TaxID=362788 RepID=A0A834TT83_9FABA|nr:Retrovirus-related Pol polyprotein from transposon TNT 1-94 [Senna tora]